MSPQKTTYTAYLTISTKNLQTNHSTPHMHRMHPYMTKNQHNYPQPYPKLPPYMNKVPNKSSPYQSHSSITLIPITASNPLSTISHPNNNPQSKTLTPKPIFYSATCKHTPMVSSDTNPVPWSSMPRPMPPTWYTPNPAAALPPG